MSLRKFGLIGYPLEHSFSKQYFSEKFIKLGIADAYYELMPLPDIALFPVLLTRYPQLRGLNVTIPHKQTVIPYLDELDQSASRVGAVNTIRIDAHGHTKGYNTDYPAFLQTLKKIALPAHLSSKALVLGNGGAAKAVIAALEDLNIDFWQVSRTPGLGMLSYQDLNHQIINQSLLIINTTPLGTFPNTNATPDIDFSLITASHLLYDLVYNPAQTEFMRLGRAHQASATNGLEMLHLQADLAWQIFCGE